MCTCTSIICAARRRDVDIWLNEQLMHQHINTTWFEHKDIDAIWSQYKGRDEVNTHGEERTDN